MGIGGIKGLLSEGKTRGERGNRTSIGVTRERREKRVWKEEERRGKRERSKGGYNRGIDSRVSLAMMGLSIPQITATPTSYLFLLRKDYKTSSRLRY